MWHVETGKLEALGPFASAIDLLCDLRQVAFSFASNIDCLAPSFLFNKTESPRQSSEGASSD